MSDTAWILTAFAGSTYLVASVIVAFMSYKIIKKSDESKKISESRS